MKKQEERELSLADLHADINIAFKNDKLLEFVNTPAHEEWLLTHPTATHKDLNGKSHKNKYVAIERVHFLMQYIFQNPCYSIKQAFCDTKGNAVIIVSVDYVHPFTGEKLHQDGVGSVQILDGHSGGQKAWPAAESYAIKDACEKIGKIFGRDLNQNDPIQWSGAYSQDTTEIEQARKEIESEETSAPDSPTEKPEPRSIEKAKRKYNFDNA